MIALPEKVYKSQQVTGPDGSGSFSRGSNPFPPARIVALHIFGYGALARFLREIRSFIRNKEAREKGPKGVLCPLGEDAARGTPVFNRTVTLKDTWAKLQKQGRHDER